MVHGQPVDPVPDGRTFLGVPADGSLVQEAVDLRVVELPHVLVAAFLDRAPVDDLLEEAVPVGEVGTPAEHDDPDAVLAQVLGAAAVAVEVVAGREVQHLGLDAHAGEPGGQRLGRPVLLEAVLAGCDLRAEPVRHPGEGQFGTGRLQVPGGVLAHGVAVEGLVAVDGRREDRGGDVAADGASVRLLHGGLVRGELHGAPAVHVVERRDPAGQAVDPGESGERVVRVGAQLGIRQDALLGGGLDPEAREVDVRLAGEEHPVHLVRVLAQVHLDAFGPLPAYGIGLRVPVRVALQDDELPALVGLDAVRPGGHGSQAVSDAGVAVPGDRCGARHGGQQVHACEGFGQPEDEGAVVRGLDGDRSVHLGLAPRAAVVGAQQVAEVGGADAQYVRAVVAPGDRVLDVRGDDGSAVLVEEAGAQPVRPGPSAVGALAERLRQVGHEPLPGLAGRGVEGHQGPADEAQEVPGVGVVRVAGVERVEVVGADQAESPAQLVGRGYHAVDGGVEAGGARLFGLHVPALLAVMSAPFCGGPGFPGGAWGHGRIADGRSV